MSASLWLKSNRPGAQLLARIVLPNEPDPNNLDSRLTTFIRGEAYRNAILKRLKKHAHRRP